MAIQFYNGLNVTGSATIAGNITITKNQPELTINDTVASDLQLVIKQSGSTSVFKSRGGTNSTGQYNFQITNGSTTTNALFINQQALSTFAGNVSLISAGTPILTIQDTTNNVKLLLYAQDGNAHVGTYSNHDLVFDTNSIKALTIDTSQNATFTGLVSGITPTAAANFVTKAYADALTPGDGVFLPLTAGNTKPLTGDLYVNSSLYIRGGNERIYMSGGGATDWRGIEASSTGLWSWGETGIGNYFSKSVGIGTGPALGRELLVKGEIAALDNTGTNDNQILMAVNDTVGNLAVTYGSTGSYVPFQLETSGQPRFGVSTAGAIRFNTYGAGTLRSDASGNITSVTSGVGTGTVTAVGSGAGLTGGTITSTGSLSHADTSSQGSVNGSNGVVIQDVTLDGFGHVTGLDTVNIETFLERGYVQKDSIDNTAIGWYTIATNGGDRAIGRFGLWDTASSRHQSVIFYAGHMFGTDGSNTITVLANNRFGTSVLRYLRIKDDTTYQGAALQVYIDDATNNLNIAILGDDFQSNGWVREDFTPDADPPGGISAAAWASFTTAGQVDLDQVDQGGIVTTGPVYSGGDTTQYRNLTTNDGSGETPAIISNGSTPTLNSGITGLEVRTLIGAGTSSSSGVTSVSDDGGSTINVSGSSTARVVSAITGTVSSSSANLATGAQIQTAIDTATTGAVKFVSEWDASGISGGGSPDLQAVATHIPGNYYIVSVAGSSAPNGNGTTPNVWAVGDWCIRADLATDTWQKIDNTQVGNVQGQRLTTRGVAVWTGLNNISSTSVFITSGADLEAGTTSATQNRAIRSLAGDSYQASLEAYGDSQGTGVVYVGQSTTYGGGIVYNGDGSPAFGNSTTDTISFYRREAGTNSEVFRYGYGSATVTFQGDILPAADAASTLGGSTKRWNFGYFNNTITITDGNINAGSAFSFNQGAAFLGDIVAPGVYVGAANTSYDFYNNGTSYLNGNTTIDANLTVSSVGTTSSVATMIMYGKRTNGTNGAFGEIIFSNNGDSVATVAGFRDGADDKGSLVFQTQNGSAGFGTRLTIAADGPATFTNNITTPESNLEAVATVKSFGVYTSSVRLIDTPNGGLQKCRVITDDYGEWILVGRFAASAMNTIALNGTWGSVSGLSLGTAQNETTSFSADFGDSFPTEVRIMGATDFSRWRDTRTIDFIYGVPQGRKWKFFFSGGATNGMTSVGPNHSGNNKFGWNINGSYDGFGRWINPLQTSVGMSDANVTNPSAAYTTATASAFAWDTADDAKITVTATRTFSGQDSFETAGFGNDDNIYGFFDEYPSETNNMQGGVDFSSAAWVLIKIPNVSSGGGGGDGTSTAAILSDGSLPSLNTGISAAEVRSLIGAGTSSSSGVTSVATGNGISGGTITSTGTLTVGAGDGLSQSSTGLLVDSTVVRTSGTQSIAGAKTFTTTPISVTRSTADSSTYLATTAFVKNQGYTTNTGTLTGSGVATRVAFWSGTTSLSADAALYWDDSNNRLGIGTASPSTLLTLEGGHSTSRFNLFYNDALDDRKAFIDMWCSEPGVTYNGSGIGANIAGSPYYGRKVAAQGQTYIRFIAGAFEIYTGPASSGTASTGIKRLTISTAGDIDLSGNMTTGGNLTTAGYVQIGGNTQGYLAKGNTVQNLYYQAGGSSSDAGFSAFAGNGNHVWQIYGAGTDYGFLNANWASWDLRKTKGGSLFMNNSTTYSIDTNSNSKFAGNLNLGGSMTIGEGNTGSLTIQDAGTNYLTIYKSSGYAFIQGGASGNTIYFGAPASYVQNVNVEGTLRGNIINSLGTLGCSSNLLLNGYIATNTSSTPNSGVGPIQNFSPSGGNMSDTTSDLGTMANGNVVRTAQEATFEFTRAEMNALPTANGSGITLLKSPGTNKYVIVEKATFLVNYSYNTNQTSINQRYEIDQDSNDANDADLVAYITGETLNSITYANGAASAYSSGMYENDTGRSTLNRTYRPDKETTLRRVSSSLNISTAVTSIRIKLRYRVWDTATF